MSGKRTSLPDIADRRQAWEASGGCQPGRCQRCGQPDVPLRGGRCRACLIHVREHGPATARQPWVQLWFALPGAGMPRGPARWTRAGEPQAAPTVSPHRTDPAQLPLFHAPRLAPGPRRRQSPHVDRSRAAAAG